MTEKRVFVSGLLGRKNWTRWKNEGRGYKGRAVVKVVGVEESVLWYDGETRVRILFALAFVENMSMHY